MKKSLLTGLILLLSIFHTVPVFADEFAAYQTARVEYISAWVALGTYNDRIGRIVHGELSAFCREIPHAEIDPLLIS